MEPEDLDMLYNIENNVKLWNVGITNVPYSRYILHDYIANASNDIYTDRQVRLIVESENKESVGIVDIVNFEPQHCRAEIGIVIQNTYRGRGFARAAIRETIHYSSKVLHLHQLYAIICVDNEKSINLFKSLGFNQNAILKDWLFDGKGYYNAAMMQIFF